MVPTIDEEEEAGDTGEACKSGRRLQFQLQFQQVGGQQRERLNSGVKKQETSDKRVEVVAAEKEELSSIKINKPTRDKISKKRNKLLERASSFAFSQHSPDKLAQAQTINRDREPSTVNTEVRSSSSRLNYNNDTNSTRNNNSGHQFDSNRPIKNQSNSPPTSPYKNSSSLSSNYISSLVNKSSILLSSLKQSYNSLTTGTAQQEVTTPLTPTMSQPQSQAQAQAKAGSGARVAEPVAAGQANERNAATRASAPEQASKRDSESCGKLLEFEGDSSNRMTTTVKVTNNRLEETTGSSLVFRDGGSGNNGNSSSLNQQQNLEMQSVRKTSGGGGEEASKSQTSDSLNSDTKNSQASKPPKPPLPPPPPKEVLQAALIGSGSLSVSGAKAGANPTSASQAHHHLQITTLEHQPKLATTTGTSSVGQQLSGQSQSGFSGNHGGGGTNCSTQTAAAAATTTTTTTQIITDQAKTQAPLSITQSPTLATTTTTSTANTASSSTTPSGGLAGSRRHALQEQSLERDAALSLKVKDLKHKRTSSIKSALRHAHLGPLRSFNLDKRTSSSSAAAASSSSSSSNSNQSSGSKLVKSMPYELFEPPVTQRTFQRTKRRGAMMSDPRRQMSADTIGLRQLTDEYLHNAGVKPMSSSGQCSLVALAAQTAIPSGSSLAACVNGTAASQAGPSSASAVASTKRTPTIGTYSSSALMSAQQQQQHAHINSPQLSIETQLYQVGKHALTSGSSRKSSGATICSQDSLSNVTILPGNLPWQSDVSIQCEILQPPPSVEPYETTGDILNTIAGPFRGATLVHANSTTCGSGPGSLDSDRGAHQLGATLKRGLTAISQHHLTPGSGPGSSALNVVGSLKKSLSNTLDISHIANARTTAAVTGHLHSQDSLPAYSSLLNEPDSDNDDRNSYRTGSNGNGNGTTATNQNNNNNNNNNNHSSATLDPEIPGFIGHLTSKLTRQGSKKFSVSKKGLQRALSFDCRGYKRLEHHQAQNQSNESSSSVSARNLLSAANKRAHNKSTLALNMDLAPRPYLPQSASQVDFQVPLLPYHKMQEAIVSQRLLDPRAPSSAPKSVEEEVQSMKVPQHDADELLCAQTIGYTQDIVEPQRLTLGQQQNEQQQQNQFERDKKNSGNLTADVALNQQAATNRRPPRLVLDIPTIATPNSDHAQTNDNKQQFKTRTQNNIQPDEEDGEEANANTSHDESARSTLVVCLPSPNISLDPSFNALSNSPSFCIDQNNKSSIDSRSVNQLTASDVFSRSKIKRPSTMVVSDAMNQVAQALNSTTSSTVNKQQQQQQQQQEGVSPMLRNRRRAIVPPKLATDGSTSDGDNKEEEAKVGQLVDVDDDDGDGDDNNGNNDENNNRGDQDRAQLNLEDEATLKAFRRKRSGGGTEKTSVKQRQQQEEEKSNRKSSGSQPEKRLFGSQNAIPTFYIEPSDQPTDEGVSASVRQTPDIGGGGSTTRPESQMTNVDSLVSSGSSTNLSLSGKNRDFTVTSPGGLTVSFGSSRGRRRSSIAVIPQMQICPGDLLVYSKQLIDRMNQSEETEPPQFLTIDDKKGKNIWSSFKLCAQFDNRTLKARNELLCSLEDVLASLQPSTFVDEQLSHYKGMLWNEFLYETESRRSASSDGLALLTATLHEVNVPYEQSGQEMSNSSRQKQQQPAPTAKHELLEPTKSRSIPARDSGVECVREPLKVTMSSGGTAQSKTNVLLNNTLNAVANSNEIAAQTAGSGHRSRDPTCRSISSRFREKPKLKRGQTVDSVFRIPLIPSSPLKHAQQHQQTPTAHLEQDDLITIEDDERSSPSASSRSVSQEFSLNRRNRSASTRSRSGSSNRTATNIEHGLTNNSNNNQLNSSDKHVTIRTSPSSPLAGSSVSTTISASKATQDKVNDIQDKDQDSSFETDDAMDLMMPEKQQQDIHNSNNNKNKHSQLGQVKSYNTGSDYDKSLTKTPHQIVRQSSLSTLSSTITRTEQKRQRALWDLFQSECTFFFDHLMTLKNVYMEPLKKIQVEGFAMFADPDVLFGNLDELCCGVYDFCKEFLYIIMRTLKTRPEELNATDVLIKLYKKNPKIDHLRGVYHRYTLNYINALTYLESLRRQVEFVEFEKWSSRDVRCKKLQLTDLLVAPVQHIMRVPIILKDIESHTENPRDREEIIAILAVEEASLRELDDKMRWLKNFERLLEIQKNISWPSILELDPKLFIPEFLKDVLSKQPCEKLIVSPRRQIVHEGTLSNVDLGRACDMHVILFDDMLLLTRRKKGLTKKASTVCKTNSGGPSQKDDGSYKYIVYKQPLSLDRFYVHDVQQVDAQAIGMKYLFLLIIMNRFQQIINVHSFSAPNDDVKQTWLFKIKKTADRWKKNLSNGNNEQQQNEPIVGQYISTSANVPTTQEPTSAHNSALHQNRSSTIKQPTPKVDKPAATCSD